MPSFNFPSAATAVVMTGATPVFVDVDESTLNLTTAGVAAALTGRTRAIVVLHYAGSFAPVQEISALARHHGIHVIEDAAHGLGVRGDRGILGSFGTFATYSFHETKNFHCGEGGALQINDSNFIERAEVLREKGTNRQRFFRGQVAKYSWIDEGSSWLLADPLAGLLLGQLEEFSEIQKNRTASHEYLRINLTPWANSVNYGISPPSLHQENAAHLFYIIASSLEVRQQLLQHLKNHGVSAAFHYQPLHNSIAGMRFGRSGSCTKSVSLGDRLLRLPLYYGLQESDLGAITNALTSFAL